MNSLEFISKFRTHSSILVIVKDIETFDFNSLHQISLQQGLNIKVLLEKAEEAGDSLYPSNEVDFVLYSTFGTIMLDTTGVSSYQWDPLYELKKSNKSFQVVGFSCPPYVVDDNNNLTGLDVELVKLILRNWPIYFKILKEKTNPYPNMEQMLKNRTVDMSSCASWLTLKIFATKASLTSTYAEQCFTFLVHKPSRLPDSTFMFQCFQLRVWYFIIFVICVLVFSMTIFQRVSSEKKVKVEQSLIFVLNRLVGNSFEEKYTSRSKLPRNMAIFWSVCSLLIITYYNAGLTSILQYPRVDLQINSVDDMVKMNIHWLEHENKGLKAYLRSYGGIYADIANLFIYEKNVSVINMKIRSGKFALPVEVLPGGGLRKQEILDEYGRNNMKVLPKCLIKHYSVYILQSNSPYQRFISRKILEIISYGFVEILFKKAVDKIHKKIIDGYYSVYTGDVNNILSLSKIQGGFWLILIVWLMGVICLIYERYRKCNII
ncbi:hypothetical protein HHI36_014149 [Cryptolaemus montrouzieri]|uniref:Ionotropic glutamate receptor C-terminal domain-containing protein n=1 Tax=Cryptolaemus montrouzieri TaxID=559131 RepID=A0ABD2N1P8_9CUCU